MVRDSHAETVHVQDMCMLLLSIVPTTNVVQAVSECARRIIRASTMMLTNGKARPTSAWWHPLQCSRVLVNAAFVAIRVLPDAQDQTPSSSSLQVWLGVVERSRMRC
jgi:hypothetical protein